MLGWVRQQRQLTAEPYRDHCDLHRVSFPSPTPCLRTRIAPSDKLAHAAAGAKGGLPRRERLLDEDRSALVVHADPDDYRFQPSGNSGARIACGMIEG
jgi:Cu-Zn family superoxide dismutase